MEKEKAQKAAAIFVLGFIGFIALLFMTGQKEWTDVGAVEGKDNKILAVLRDFEKNEHVKFIDKSTEDGKINVTYRQGSAGKDLSLLNTANLGYHLSKIKDGGISLNVRWFGPRKDIYGNTEVVFVNEFIFNKDTFDRINWKEMKYMKENLMKVADKYKENKYIN